MSHLLTDYRLLHNHIPRTGGTWVTEALRILEVTVSMKFQFRRNDKNRLPLKHPLLTQYSRKDLGHWDTSFSFVRHPVKYYESVWAYLYDIGYVNRARFIKIFSWHPFTEVCQNWDDDFNTWAEKMLEGHPGWVSHLFEMYVGPEGGEFCEYIGRTERLVDDFCEIMADYDLYDDRIRQLEKQNVSKVKRVWDESLKFAVAGSEHIVIGRFYGDNFNVLRYISNIGDRKSMLMK